MIPATSKAKRIRDPVHNLIEFGADRRGRQLENALWQAIQTRPFQRLRRIKQLGFSELVFPGATHTRFAHSLGVFHTARLLLAAIERFLDQIGSTYRESQAGHALAAALLHDVGHGMFSHAFEAVGKQLGLPLADHEVVSAALIRDGEIKEVLDSAMEPGFAANVAALIGREQPRHVYDAVVSSQFDADRLDYMQRDRMMTGLHSGTVDVTWLLHNLQVAPMSFAVDNEQVRSIETLVLGPKAFHVAESYVVALFHLYPNVYLHKATRGAEMVLRDLIVRLHSLRGEPPEVTGLPYNHPLIRFLANLGSLQHAQALDDTVLWGALPMLSDARDAQVKLRAHQLLDRGLLACLDIRNEVAKQLPPADRENAQARAERIGRINLTCSRVMKRQAEAPCALFDDSKRDPYKKSDGSRTPPNQIHIMQDGAPRDMAELSVVVASAEPFRVCRAYFVRDDTATGDVLRNIIRTSLADASDGG